MSAPSSSSSRRSHLQSSFMFTNAIYFPNYRIYKGDTPGAMNYSCISLVYYGFATLAVDGGVLLSDEWADAGAPCDGMQGGLGSLMNLKIQNPHLKVVLSIGGMASIEAFAVVASDPVLRDAFARSAKDLVDASGLDGIDIDWEFPCDQQQGADFLALVAAARLHMPDYVITAALPGNRDILQNIPVGQAAEYLDFINLMAFDYFGPWSEKSGHHAQLYAINRDEGSGAASVGLLMAAGVHPKSILLGVPLYGRSFLHVQGPGHKFKGVGGDDGTFDYSDLPRKTAKEQTNKQVCAAQCVGGDGGFVSYDNTDTVRQKAAFAKQKGLGGLFYWNGPADSKDKTRSLIAAGFRTLHSS